jgi:uncharacterized alkaline shock family protein YloU
MNDTSKNSSPLDGDDIDGHTIESLSDYLDRGRLPRDASIEASAAAQHALAALSRLRSVAPRVVAAGADHFAPKNDNWISRILDQIGVQAHAGRDIPISHEVEGAILAISEGAVRALVREAGDLTDGLLVEKSRLDGDVESAGAPVDIRVVVSTFDSADAADVIAEFQERVRTTVQLHTDLVVASVTVQVHKTDLDDDDDLDGRKE